MIKIYKWIIESEEGNVRAKNMREAIKKSLKIYLSEKDPPYISETVERLDILIERITKKELEEDNEF